MRISDGRVNYLSRRIAKDLVLKGLTKETDLDSLALEVKKGFNYFLQDLDKIEEKVISKIASIKRGVPEGSSEWEILYRQYYNEEVSKL